MPTEQEIYALLNEIFRETLNDPSISLTPDSTADTVPGWDSMSHILLLISIELRFGVKFLAAETEELKTVGDLVEVLKKKTDA